jgi:DNA end-binding protein Ku
VDLEEIDPLFYDHPYYLLPGTGAAKPYKLLVTAMDDAQKVAIARVVIRQKEQLVAIRPTSDGVLAMSTMNFADEVIGADKFDDAPGEEVETSKREVDMAKQLIESLSSEWEPGKYHDTYRERVLELIEQKAQGKEIAVQPVEEPQPVPDLMAALEASVKAARQEKGSGGRAPADGDGAAPKRKRATSAKNGSGSGKKTKAKAKAKS